MKINSYCVAALISIASNVYANITTKTLNMNCGELHSSQRIQAENGTIGMKTGVLSNVHVLNTLTIDVKENLFFSNSSIGDTLIVKNNGLVKLSNVNVVHLVVYNKAQVYIDNLCKIGSIEKHDEAQAHHVNEFKN